MAKILTLLAVMVVCLAQAAEEAPIADDAATRRVLTLIPQIVTTGQGNTAERLSAGVAQIFKAQELERARLVAYRDLPEAIPDHPPFLALVGYDPSARQFDQPADLNNPNRPGVALTTSSPALAYTLADFGLQFADAAVRGAPGRRYLSKVITMVDDRSKLFGGGLAVAGRDHQNPGATLISALSVMAGPTLDGKVANADLLRGVIQTHDLILAQLTKVSAFAELRQLHRHALLRLQIGGIPADFLYERSVSRVSSHADVIATNALDVYTSTASVTGDIIDDGSLESWMNSVFKERYTVNRAAMATEPPLSAFTGDEDVLIGSPKTVDDLMTVVIGLSATYATALAQRLVAVGEAVDSDVDRDIAEINAFDNYMQNVWAVDHSRNADGSIDFVKLARFRAIIRPAMERARERAIAYYNERIRLAYARGNALLKSANIQLGAFAQAKADALAASGALLSDFVDRVLATRLGDKAMPANPLFVVQALEELVGDVDRAVSAFQSDAVGSEVPPVVDETAIAADADQWLYDKKGWGSVSSRYAGFPYPAAVDAMSYQDHLTALWISSLGAVDALGAADETEKLPAEVQASYRVVRGSPYLFMQAISSLADFKVILMGIGPSSGDARQRMIVQFAAEFGPTGRAIEMLKELRSAVAQLQMAYSTERETRLSLEVPSQDGNAILVSSSPGLTPGERPSEAPLAGGVTGFLPLQSTLSGYGIVMSQIDREITEAALRAGRILSIAQRRLLVRSGLLSVTNPSTALVSPSSILLMDMRRAVAIQLGRALRDAASYRPGEGLVQPNVPKGSLPPATRLSAKYQVELLGDGASPATAGKVAQWILQGLDHGMRMQWASYRIAALRVAMQDLDALAASAYATSLVEENREDANANKRTIQQRRKQLGD